MHSTIPSAIPVWVFAVLFGLLALGSRQARTRVVAPGTLALVASAMLVFSLYGVTAAFGTGPAPVLAWAAGLAAAVTLGARVLAPTGLARVGESVRIPGSWIPMGLLLGIFAIKFMLGFAAGTGSLLIHEPALQAAASLALGLLSGGFSARALAVHRFMRQASAA